MGGWGGWTESVKPPLPTLFPEGQGAQEMKTGPFTAGDACIYNEVLLQNLQQ
jgi:hypothetical protein